MPGVARWERDSRRAAASPQGAASRRFATARRAGGFPKGEVSRDCRSSAPGRISGATAGLDSGRAEARLGGIKTGRRWPGRFPDERPEDPSPKRVGGGLAEGGEPEEWTAAV